MNIKIKLFAVLAFFFLAILIAPSTKAQGEDNINAYLFHGDGCPHCADEQEFLAEISSDYPQLEVKQYEIYNNKENREFLKEAARELDVQVSGVPFLIIGEDYFSGFLKGVTSKEIIEKLNSCSETSCPDPLSEIAKDYQSDEEALVNSTKKTDNSKKEENNKTAAAGEKIINLPLLGEVDAMKYSLPAITIIMGILDGFNPCAMWVLLFLISLLLEMKDRRRMWTLGTAFIVASAFVYFIFMAAWLNLIMFLGFIAWIRIIIGLLALFGGGYSLRDFFVNKKAGCKVVGTEKKRRTFDKMKDAVHKKSLWLALIGIVVLAFAVNLVELVCSAGLPAVYTQILVLNDMAGWKYYGYILLYILFFMIDDLIIFFIAMTTLRVTGLTTKYTRASRLIGGIIMLIIGLMLIFRPEWLMFG